MKNKAKETSPAVEGQEVEQRAIVETTVNEEVNAPTQEPAADQNEGSGPECAGPAETLETPESAGEINVDDAITVNAEETNFAAQDFEEEGQDPSLSGDNEPNTSEEEALPKYNFSQKKLEDYLASSKEQDKIIQISRNGNFVSSKDHTIYVPITLFQ